MEIPEEWGKTRYDDILKKYKLGKGHLFFIITEPDIDVIARKLKLSRDAIKQIRDRHKEIKRKAFGKR